MKYLAIIPTKFASNRFPGKLLYPLMGKPILSWVIDYAKKIFFFNDIVIATEDKEIINFITRYHPDIKIFINKRPVRCGSERTFEVYQKNPNYDMYVSLPADEPLIDYKEINKLHKTFEFWFNRDDEYNMNQALFTLYTKFYCREDLDSNLSCKLVSNQNDYMLYGSRAVIPFDKKGEEVNLDVYKKHIGIIGFSKIFLSQYGEMLWDNWKSNLEDIEGLEQDRFVDMGQKVRLFEIKHNYFGIDQEWQIKILEDRYKLIHK